ncbi:MAG: DUF1573 domain-containing protein [Nannocystales bacterium]
MRVERVIWSGALLLLGACRDADEAPEADNGVVTGADVELPEPVDCEAFEIADRLRWTGNGAASPGLRSVAVHGARGFTCSDDGGLATWELSSEAPALIEESDQACTAVATDGTWLAVARASEVELRTVDDTAVVGTWATASVVESMTLLDGRLWVAAGVGGWAELDVEAGLQEVRRFSDEQSDARAVTAIDGFAYVADARAGLRAFELGGDDALLRETLAIDPVLDVVAHDGGLAVATVEGVAWIGISNPASPELLGQAETPGSALAVEVVGGQLVTADFKDIAVVSGEDEPRLLDVEPLIGDDLLDRTRALSVDPVTGRLFVAQWDTLQAFDTACDGASPSLWPDRRTVDFRVVSARRTRSLAVSLRNQGDAPLAVSEVRTSMVGVTNDFEPLTIAPGNVVAFEVTFESPDTQPYEGALEIVSNDPDQPVFVLPMSANIRGVRVGEPVVPFRNVDTLGRVWEPDDALDKVLLLAYFADW